MRTVLVLGHDGVAESEQREELVDVRVSLSDQLEESCVVERERALTQRVVGEVHLRSGLPTDDTTQEQR